MAPSRSRLLQTLSRNHSRNGAAPDASRRIPHLAAAIVGNGELLVTLSARAEVERLFWPHIDWGQHLGELRLGVTEDGKTRWLDEPPFEHEQRYLNDANVLETVARTAARAFTISDLVDPVAPVLMRRVETNAPPARLVLYIRPELDESVRYGSVYVDQAARALVFYRRGRALALGMSPQPEARAGRIEPGAPSSVFADALDGSLQAGAIEYGQVDGALSAQLDGTAVCAAAFAATPEQATALVAEALAEDFDAALARRCQHDLRVLARAHEPLESSPQLRRLYRRSVLTFDLLTDRSTGGVIAAPEMDEQFQRSGGYGFVWGRDMAFSALAFLAAGRFDLARPALHWLRRTQSAEGMWLHRHCADGSLAPSWGLHQIDETGAAIFAFEATWRETGDEALDRQLWPAAQRAADFLLAFRDTETGLPLPSVDLWEERWGRHAYSAAAVYGGLRAAAAIAARHDSDRAADYAAAASEIAAAIEHSLWDERSMCFLRGIDFGLPTGDAARLPYPEEIAASVAGPPKPDAGRTIDASLLGLGWPYAAVEPGGDRMRRTIEALQERLTFEDGGLARYDGDTYAGGNAWLLTTLWLGLWHRQVGDDSGHRRSIAYAIGRQTPVGLLPEQCSASGSPTWVVPLTWSHAMFVLATRPDLQIVRDFTAAPGRAGLDSAGLGNAKSKRSL